MFHIYIAILFLLSGVFIGQFMISVVSRLRSIDASIKKIADIESRRNEILFHGQKSSQSR